MDIIMYKLKNGQIIYSPSDLTTYMASPFASWMDRLQIEKQDHNIKADPDNELISLLSEKGFEHEKIFFKKLEKDSLIIVDIGQVENDKKFDETINAMQQGVDVIYQAKLQLSQFSGYSDFLRKVPTKSQLGDYSYEVWDTKLAFSIKPDFIIQLCCYSEILESIQGYLPKNIVVALGNDTVTTLATHDYYNYYFLLKRQFLEFQENFNADAKPNPFESDSYGRWSEYAQLLLKEKDHLSQIANITKNQIKKIEQQNINTCDDLIKTQLNHIPQLSDEIFNRLKDQATIQKESEGLKKPLYKILELDKGNKQGLSLLPPHSDKDVFFDIEGYPLIEGGLEYLWGNTYFDEQGKRQFKDFWAHDREQEKKTFKQFIEWVFQRWLDDHTMHIYHYASYEITACRKLMGRYGVCEYEVDQLLRNNVFVDLYKIVRHGLLVGEPRYSIKNVEHLYRPKRETEVADGGASIVVYEHWRNQPDGDIWQHSDVLENIRKYNIDDCDSTQELVDWLRKEQKKHNITYIGRQAVQEAPDNEEIDETNSLRNQLLELSEKERHSNPKKSNLSENMAWFLEFHRRENKPVYWKLFDRLGMTHAELRDDYECLSECVRTTKKAFKPTPKAKNLAYEYQFDAIQEFKGAASRFFILGEEDDNGKNISVNYCGQFSDLNQGLIVVQSKLEPPSIITGY
jgi:uncharacterized protein